MYNTCMNDRWKITTKEYRVTLRCQQDEKHAKMLRIDYALGAEWLAILIGLLEGSSPLYIMPPGPSSPIGRCGVCGGKLKCTLEIRGPDAEPD
jgi:hypothetical protein